MSLAWMREHLGNDALTFAALRGLAMVGGVAALLIVPPRPEHQGHLAPLLGGFIVYNVALLAVLTRWATRAREIFLAALAADLAFVFLLVWFTGGVENHVDLLFYLLVALYAYYFGPGIGMVAAALAAGLLEAANWLAPSPAPWLHVGSRAVLLGLLALPLGHVAAGQRAARTRAERLNAELRAAMARLEEAGEQVIRAERLATAGQISSRMAHEVRSPISAISLNVEMLEEIVEKCPGPMMGDAGELLRGIRAEVGRLAVLTDEYLTFARLPRPRAEEDSLNEMLEELMAFVRPDAERRGVTLTAELDPLIPLFSFDRDLLRRAVLNLVKNGMQATPRGGRVRVATRLDGRWVEVAVSDTGSGIEERHAPHLFEPFFTTKPRGTGLGLAIARQIAEEHGGTLAGANDPEGGARFTLRLPLKGTGRD